MKSGLLRPIAALSVTIALLTWQGEAQETAAPERVEADAARSIAKRVERDQQTAPAARPAPERDPWVAGEVMARAAEGESFTALARRAGARVVRMPGPSGYGRLAPRDGADTAALLEALSRDPAASASGPIARVWGAAIGDHQWHLEAVNTPSSSMSSSGVVVAVIDSGVAYEHREEEGGGEVVEYVRASSLSGTTFVSPWDFVNGDSHANDDHGHGTHIATTIAANGSVDGTARGVDIMPVKVLDGNNSGNEVDLVDGIWHAVDSGADVINMSLSFGAGYAPSVALMEALQAASDAGIAMVAAAGNSGEWHVTWPAAHPRVIAVAANSHEGIGSHAAANYANLGPMVDVMAPGGDLDNDNDGDGYPDGILAESVDLDEEEQSSGYYFSVGSSQAAAVVSGAVARLVDAGATPDEALAALQYTADYEYNGGAFLDGHGAGSIDIGKAVEEFGNQKPEIMNPTRYHASVLPYLAASGSGVRPEALVTIIDDAGALADDVMVYGTIYGDGGGSFECSFYATGRCLLSGDVASIDPSVDEHAWVVTVDAVFNDNIAARPSSALFVPDGLGLVIEAMDAAGIDDALLGFSWDAGDDPELGAIEASYSIVDLGSGLASIPLGVVITPPVLGGATFTTVDVDLDGTGLTTLPFGTTPISLVTDLDGTGLTTLPFGTTPISLLDGTGLSSSPLAFHPGDVVGPGAGDLAGSSLDWDGAAVILEDNHAVGVSLAGTALGDRLDDGGFVTEGGSFGGSAFAASGVEGADPVPVGAALEDAAPVAYDGCQATGVYYAADGTKYYIAESDCAVVTDTSRTTDTTSSDSLKSSY